MKHEKNASAFFELNETREEFGRRFARGPRKSEKKRKIFQNFEYDFINIFINKLINVKIYIDESGDIGFSERSSQYFVLAALIVRNPLAIRRCFAKLRRNKLYKKHRELPEFKFNNSSPEIKRRILSCIGSGDVDICYCILRKDDVRHHLRTRQQIVYNYLTGLLISNIVLEYSPDDGIQITVDKSLNGIQREAFDQYVVFKTMERNMVSDPLPPIQIVHADSVREPCIQAVDFVAGALHYYYRENDDTYSRIVDPKIRLVLDFFKGRQKR